MYPKEKDVYIELRVARRGGAKVVMIRVLLVLLLSIIFSFSMLFSPMLGNYAIFLYAIVAFAFVYAWKWQKRLDVEYEYIFTNGDLDIDKIIGREDRKRRYSVHCKELEFFEPYENPAKYENMKYDRIAFPCSDKRAAGLWCLSFREHSYGKCLVVINMNDELRGAIQACLPKWGR